MCPVDAVGTTIGVDMRIILSDFMSLDGVVQAPGGRMEDSDGGFTNGERAG